MCGNRGVRWPILRVTLVIERRRSGDRSGSTIQRTAKK
jgi:hypothetical protein